jgi:hypothetical protein
VDDVVVDAIENEIKLVGMPVNTDKNFMARHCSHISSGSTGDAHVQTRGELLVTPKVHGQMISCRSNWIYAVTIDAVLQENGQWKGTFGMNGAFSNACLEGSEKEKYCKHEAAYENLNLGFLAFAASSFGAIGDDLLRFLYLASLEVAKINQKQQAMGIPALTDQRIDLLRSRCLAASTARIGHAIHKATAMRLMGVPSVPILPLVPRSRQSWIVYEEPDWTLADTWARS